MGIHGSNGTDRHAAQLGTGDGAHGPGQTPSSADVPAGVPAGADADAHATEAIAAFWDWWAAGGKAEASELFAGRGDQGRFERFGEEIGARVQAIGDLAVATGPGHAARHCLVLTAGGMPELRGLAAAWLAAAPPADAEFEYADHRQPHPDPESLALRFEGGEIGLAATTVVAVAADGKVHVQLVNPAFAELGDDDRAQVSFLFLDAVLGERVVEERIGQIAWAGAHEEGAPAVSLLELPGIVADAP